MSLRLTTLGAPRAYRSELELPDLPSQRLRFALLVYLAVEGGASRDAILSMFWPDRDAARARHALRQMIYELRQLLGDDWVEVGRDRIGVCVEVDVRAFEEAAGAGRLADALALYQGEFLAGFSLDSRAFEGWLDRHRAQLGRLHRRLRRERIEELLRARAVSEAVTVAQEWVELDPLEDEAHHGLIRCLALQGQRMAALRHYESYERQLAGELQLAPLDETRALVARIRSGDFGADDLVPAAPPLRREPSLPAEPGPARPAEARAVPAEPARHGDAGGAGAVPGPRSGWRHRRAWLPAGAVGLAAVLVAALFPWDPPTETPRATPTARLVVLPFATRSADTTMNALAGALTESLARTLARSRPLDVVPPMSVAMLQSQGVPHDSVGRLFQADYLVAGSVMAGPAGVRVAVELLDGRTGSLLRSEVVERPGGESRNLVEDVVAGSADILRREIGRHVEVRRVRASTASEEAWRSVLAARSLQELTSRYLVYRDWTALDEAFSTADSLLARAAELDRRWAEPLVMRGWIMERRAQALSVQSPADTAGRRKLFDAARSLADRATERDPDFAGGYELRGRLLSGAALMPQVPLDSARAWMVLAEEQLGRAALLDPQNAAVHRARAEVLTNSARFAAAKTAAQRAYDIDPFGSQAAGTVALLHATSLNLGEDEEAERWCLEGRRAFGRQGPFVHCLFELHAWGEPSRRNMRLLVEELASYRKSGAALQPHLVHHLEVMLAVAYHRAGQPDSARAVFARVPVDSGGPMLPWLRSAALGAMGDEAAALKLLAAILATDRLVNYRQVRSRPFWPLHHSAEFRRLADM